MERGFYILSMQVFKNINKFSFVCYLLPPELLERVSYFSSQHSTVFNTDLVNFDRIGIKQIILKCGFLESSK